MNINNWTVHDAFRDQIVTVSSIPPDDQRAWENIAFKPDNDTPYIKENFIPGDKTLTANEELSGVGVMQYDLYYPVGSGTKEAEEVANDIEAAFKPATVLNDLVRIDQTNALQGRKEDNWWRIPIRISYTVFSIN